MPFYEYKATDAKKGCEYCKISFEIYTSILSENLLKCPKCGEQIEKIISTPASFIFLGKQMNNYNDVKHAKYWRDNNGIRHRVTAADGCTNSPTVSKRITATPEQIEGRIQKDKEATKKRLGKIRHGFMKRD
jgi:putative FmdB family regulatory protein